MGFSLSPQKSPHKRAFLGLDFSANSFAIDDLFNLFNKLVGSDFCPSGDCGLVLTIPFDRDHHINLCTNTRCALHNRSFSEFGVVVHIKDDLPQWDQGLVAAFLPVLDQALEDCLVVVLYRKRSFRLGVVFQALRRGCAADYGQRSHQDGEALEYFFHGASFSPDSDRCRSSCTCWQIYGPCFCRTCTLGCHRCAGRLK